MDQAVAKFDHFLRWGRTVFVFPHKDVSGLQAEQWRESDRWVLTIHQTLKYYYYYYYYFVLVLTIHQTWRHLIVQPPPTHNGDPFQFHSWQIKLESEYITMILPKSGGGGKSLSRPTEPQALLQILNPESTNMLSFWRSLGLLWQGGTIWFASS